MEQRITFRRIPGLIWVCGFLALICCGAYCAAQTPSSETYYDSLDEEAMRSILKSWNQSGTNLSAALPGWSPDTHPCTNWTGVDCELTTVHTGNTSLPPFDYYTLVALSVQSTTNGGVIVAGDTVISDLPIVGGLPRAILNLTNLVTLLIQGHLNLTGPLPIGLFTFESLPNLQTLSLSGCNFSGTILQSNDGLDSTLQYLDLSDNSFIKWIDSCSFLRFEGYPIAFTQLQQMNLKSNQISGEFCTGFMENIQTIDISNNKFSGINVSIIDPVNPVNSGPPLRSIKAQQNLLQSFPMELLQLPQIEEIYLDDNNIAGTLVLPNLSITSTLRLVSLVNNNITGLIPFDADKSSLFSTSNIYVLDVLFLANNPMCKDLHKDKLLRMVCRYNRSSPIDSNQSKIPIIIGISISAPVLVALIVTLFVINKLMKKISAMREIQNEFDKRDVQPNLYSYSELKLATQDFHFNNELGRGGFGIVYKGVLIDGSKVAVKRLTKSTKEKDLQDFLNEIIAISNIKHRNLIQLRGCCITRYQRILVYELVENKNLADTLWGRSKYDHLNWATRFNIILGIARGLAYLHEEVQPSIIHRDIKGPNILLDKDLNPKIGDFGLALLIPSFDDGETHLSVSQIAGTMGYLSPEYATLGQVSTKLDVFSFGVLILEIVSGRKNIDYSVESSSQQVLCQWAQRLHANNQLLELVDTSLQDLTVTEDATIKRVLEVGLLCLHHVAARRPTMSDIVAMLIGNKMFDQVPLEDQHYQPRLHEAEYGMASSSLLPTDSWSLPPVQLEISLQTDVESHGTSPLMSESMSLIKSAARELEMSTV